jgi:hypothetical protein
VGGMDAWTAWMSGRYGCVEGMDAWQAGVLKAGRVDRCMWKVGASRQLCRQNKMNAVEV